jgi:predicted nucleic acid-binding Zn ribbon protein
VSRELSRFGPQAGLGEVLALWPEAVGDAIARNAWPARIARDGTVHINTADSIWAFELGHQATEIAARLGVAPAADTGAGAAGSLNSRPDRG